MAIGFVNSAATLNAAGTSSVTVPVPASTADGHVMVALIGVIDQGAITAPAGWTLIGMSLAGSAVQYAAYYRVASGEPANYAWTWTGSFKNSGWIGTYSGVHQTDPLEGTPGSTGTSVSAAAFATAPVATTTPGAWLISGAFERHPATGASTTWTDSDSSDLERLDHGTNAGAGQDVSHAVYDSARRLDPGTYSRTLTASQTISQIATWAVALRPALAVEQQWTGTGADIDVEVGTLPTPDNWLIATVAWRVVDGSAPQMSVGDPSRNLWHLLHSTTTTAHAEHTGAQLQIQVWACPVARYEGWDQLRVFAAAQAISASDVGSVVVNVAEVSGFANGHLTVDGVVVATATAAGALDIIVGQMVIVAADAFGRTVASSWGTPDIGPVWTATGGAAADFAVSLGFGHHIMGTATNISRWTTTAAALTDFDVTATVATDVTPAGGSHFVYLAGRWTDVNNTYLARLEFTTASGVALTIRKRVAGAETSLAGGTVAGLTHAAGTRFAVRLRVAASTLQAKVWLASAPEPAAWDFSATDTDLAAAGEVGFRSILSSANTNPLPVTASFGDFTATDLSPAGAPGRLVFAGAAIDDTTKTITAAGSGYTALTQASRAGPDVEMAPSWRSASAASVASWTLSAGTANWAGVAVAIRETGDGPAQPNTNWPVTRLELALGFDMSTPLSAVRWTDQTDRIVDRQGSTTLFAPRGIPYEMGEAQSQPIQVGIRNNDGAYTPRTAGNATASASGSTSTILVADASAGDINVSDFFWLRTAAGALKELAVFQVTGVSSNAGTTTITFQRADGAGVALAATVTGDVYEGIAVDLFIPFRLRMMWGDKWEAVTSGWLGQLPQTWSNPAWGQVPAIGNDALSTLTAANPTILAGEILRRNPSAYWPLSDPSGSDAAQDVSGNGAPPLVQTLSKFGAGADNIAAFGASTQQVDVGTVLGTASLLGDPGSGWEQSGLVAADSATKGYALVGSGEFPPISGGVTILGFTIVKSDADLNVILNATADPTLLIVRNTDPGAGAQGSVIRVSVGRLGSFLLPKVTVWDRVTHAATTVTGSFQIVSSEWRLWALAFDRTSWEVYGASTLSASGSCNLADSWSIIDLFGEADAFGNGRAWNGIHAGLAVIPRKLTAQEIANFHSTEARGRLSSSETTSQRVARKLGTVGWLGPRVVPVSDVEASAESSTGGTIADQTAALAADDDGLQFLDACGQLQWRGHVTGYYQSVRATLGEDTAAGEIPFQPGQRFDYDATYLYNAVTVENERIASWSQIVQTRIVAVDADSARRRSRRTLSHTSRLEATEDAYGLAWGLLARYKDPRLRVGTVEIAPSAYPEAWRFCLSVEVGDLVTVKRRPLGAPMITQVCRVLQVTPDLGPGRARFVLSLGAADPPVLVLGDPVKGILGDATIGW